MLERGIVGQRGSSPDFLRKLVKPLGVPYEVLMSATGYTFQTKDEWIYSGAMIFMLRESLGDEIEEFARRVECMMRACWSSRRKRFSTQKVFLNLSMFMH
jgi:hypothetical protein